MFLDLRGKSEHTHNLGHPGASDPLATGDLGLTGHLSGIRESLLLDRFHYSGGGAVPGAFRDFS